MIVAFMNAATATSYPIPKPKSPRLKGYILNIA
ncbi:hypothetical protein ABIB30_000360 [Pedobacter sp. UYP1]|jgi:hypothetical protein